MKLLITGGSGYIGHSVIKALQHSATAFNEVIIYDNLSRKNTSFFLGDHFGSLPIRFVKGDILDNRTLEKTLAGVNTVVHLAAKVTTPYADHSAHEFDQVNHWGTACLVDAIEKTASVNKVIHMSSTSVYGSVSEQVDESAIPAPKTFYGVSKLRGEQQILRLGKKKPFTILRSGNVYGYNPSLRLDAVINKFMFEAQYFGKITVNGKGEQSRAFIHVQNLAQVVKENILQEEEGPQVLNVVERNLTINEVIDEVQKLYPRLERIYINQNMQMKSIRIRENNGLNNHDFHNQLKEIHDHFSL